MRRLVAVLLGSALAVGLAVAPAAAAPTVTWSAGQSVDPPRGGFADVSCVSSSWCRAAGAHGTVWGYEHGVWAPGRRLATTSGAKLTDLDCVSTRFCVANVGFFRGSGQLAVFDGSHWRVFSARAGAHNGISCVGSTFCLFVVAARSGGDADGGYRVWNGSSWSTMAAMPPYAEPSSVSCWAADGCRAIGNGKVTYWNGRGWTRHALSQGYLTDIDCPSAEICVVTANNGVAYVHRGASWSLTHNVPSDLSAVDCASTSYCVALTRRTGSSVVYYADVDRWTDPTSIVQHETVTGLSCPTAGSCHATTAEGSVLSRMPGGWSSPQVINLEAGGPTDISCASTTRCVLVDNTGAAQTYDGSSWSTPRRVVPYTGLTTVSCPTTLFCAVGASDGSVAFWRSGTWSAPQHLFGLSTLDISCVSASSCMAVGDDGDADEDNVAAAKSWNGTAWTTHVFATVGFPTTVSCVPSYCLVGFDTGAAQVHDASGWAEINPPTSFVSTIRAVSCVSASCLSVGRGTSLTVNGAARYDGTSWTDTGAPTDVPIDAVSCASATLCVSAGESGAAAYDAASWGTPTRLGSGNLTGIACRSTQCRATDDAGYVYTGGL